MKSGIRKGLEDIAWELKGLKNILSAIWHTRYAKGETDVLNPEADTHFLFKGVNFKPATSSSFFKV